MVKAVVKSLIRYVGYEVSPLRTPLTLRELNADVEPWAWEIYDAVRNYTMLSLDRVLANIRSIEYIVRNKIPGAIVECGVWRGGSSMSLAMALIHYQDTQRSLWMYDTFSGMTKPTDVDATYLGESALSLLEAATEFEDSDKSLILANASLENVRRNMGKTAYPMQRIKFVKGPIEQTLPEEMPEQIAVLRLDTDWYESTRHELINLYPRLSRGGILIIDDYGHWQGARKAVDEYFAGQPVFLHRIDYTGRLLVKSNC